MRAEYTATIALIAVSSCASAFPYKWYGIDPANGTLLGKTEAEDIPLATCQPDNARKGKCVVMFTDEFDRLSSDYADKAARLKKCETQ